MIRIGLVLIFLLSVGVSAAGQTTRPVDKAEPAATATTPAAAPAPSAEQQAWPRTVEAFAAALVRGDVATAETALSARSLVRRFDGSTGIEVTRLIERVAKSTLIGQHGYVHPPLVMAADIAADFKNAAAVPEKAKAKFVMDDDGEMKRANATAVQWVVEQVGARTGTPVGVIIFWTPRPPVPGVTAADGAVVYDTVFVLCRGDEVAPHEYKIDTVVFGLPVGEQN